MKRFVKVCTILAIIFGVIGSGCVIAAVSMGVKLPTNIPSIYRWNYSGKLKQTYSFNKENVKKIEFDVGSSDIHIVKGSGDQVTLENKENTPRMRAVLSSDGELKIEKKRYGFWFFGIRRSGTAVLTIPEDVVLEHMEIDCGSGTISAEAIRANQLSVDCGSGDVEIEEASAQQTEIDCGSGDISLALTGSKADYEYTIDCGSGEVILDEEYFSGSEHHYNHDRHGNQISKNLEIDCGSGDVTVNFLDHEDR